MEKPIVAAKLQNFCTLITLKQWKTALRPAYSRFKNSMVRTCTGVSLQLMLSEHSHNNGVFISEDWFGDHVNASDREQDYLIRSQLRSFAVFMRRRVVGAADLTKAIFEAKRLAAHPLQGEAIWHQIAEEISLIETSETLDRQWAKQETS